LFIVIPLIVVTIYPSGKPVWMMNIERVEGAS